ncbi:MAG: transcriptional repressor [Chloroflexi bacterium]|nr:transcriptional repressor [Chloroflexota bacterium]
MRKSQQRTAIFEELGKLKSHPRGDELYDIVRQRLPRISLGTVYRNLELLRQRGMVLELPCGDFNRYDGKISPHHHFLCRQCRRLWDFNPDIAPGESKPIKNTADFQIESQFTVFYGLCRQCLAKT